MKKLLNLKFNKEIQKKLNNFFDDEEYKEYKLGDLLKIICANVVVMTVIIVGSIVL